MHASTTTRFRARILGPFVLERDGNVVDTSRWQRRVEVLFKLLLTTPDRQRRRDDIIDVLWPDADADNGVGNLRMLVHRLRTTIDLPEPSPVLSEGGWIALNPECEWALDLEVLEAVASDAAAGWDELEGAAELYAGEALPEDRYEDWAQPVRERAMRAYRDVCLRLGLFSLSHGAHDDALRRFESALVADPFDEDAFRHVLAVLHAAGRSAEALRRYAALERLFMEEIGADPSSETRALVETIRSAHDSDISAPVASPAMQPLIGATLGLASELRLHGREHELEIVGAALEGASSGAGRLVVLSGEQGIGKTRMAQEVVARLAESGFLIGVGRCSRRRRPISWAPFLDAFETLVAATPASVRSQLTWEWTILTGLLTRVGTATGPTTEAGQHQLFTAASRFLSALAREQPVAIVLDDLHLADEATLDLLHHLAGESRASRIFILGTYGDADVSRQHPVSLLLRDMTHEGLVERVALRRLTPDETADLVRSVLDNDPGIEAFAEYVYRRTRGIPFFIQRALQVLGGRYQLLRLIGCGGMGCVFEAQGAESASRVAVKVIFARREAEPRMLVRFQQEAAVLARLDHPNIVKVYEAAADEYGGRLVMELLPGRSLAATVPRAGASLATIKSIGLQMASALSNAHEHGVLHRDIKPENIVVDDAGHATLTDFGIARVIWPQAMSTTLTSTAAAFGTTYYMSPEQIERSREDARSDVYSLGVVLYELVTGHTPFEGDDAVSVAVKHLHQHPVPPGAARPGLPAAWDATIMRCLAKAPSERFQSAIALESAIASLPTPELPPLDADPVRTSGLDSLPVAALSSAPGPAGAPAPAPLGGSLGRSFGGRRRAFLTVMPLCVLLAVGTFIAIEHRGSPGRPRDLTTNRRGTRLTTPDVGPQGTLAGQFDGPSGITVDPQGNVWVSDAGNNRVQELSPSGVPRAQIGSSGKRTDQFNTPEEVAVTSRGAIYVDDRGNVRIEKLTLSGTQLDELPLSGVVAVDRFNHLFVADLPHRRAWEFTWNRDPLGSWTIPDIHAERRPYPAGIAVDARDRLYVVDRPYSRVLVLVPHGSRLAVERILGNDPHQYTFNHPSDVALDTTGNIYVADTGNNRIVKLSPQGKLITWWGTAGSGLGQFNQPSSLALDAKGDVYVIDYFHDRIQKFAPNGKPLWATNGRQPIR